MQHENAIFQKKIVKCFIGTDKMVFMKIDQKLYMLFYNFSFYMGHLDASISHHIINFLSYNCKELDSGFSIPIVQRSESACAERYIDNHSSAYIRKYAQANLS